MTNERRAHLQKLNDAANEQRHQDNIRRSEMTRKRHAEYDAEEAKAEAIETRRTKMLLAFGNEARAKQDTTTCCDDAERGAWCPTCGRSAA